MGLESRVKKLEQHNQGADDKWVIQTVVYNKTKHGEWEGKLNHIDSPGLRCSRNPGEPEDEFEKRWKREHEAGK